MRPDTRDCIHTHTHTRYNLNTGMFQKEPSVYFINKSNRPSVCQPSGVVIYSSMNTKLCQVKNPSVSASRKGRAGQASNTLAM